jgi:hypothetical protein
MIMREGRQPHHHRKIQRSRDHRPAYVCRYAVGVRADTQRLP